MKCRGTIENVSINFRENCCNVKMSVSKNVAYDLENLKEKDLAVEIKPYKERRSLNANAYYWQLLAKISAAVREPVSYRHNMNLRELGYIEIMEGQAVFMIIPESEECQRKVDRYEHLHLKPTSQVREKNGKLFRTYMMLRGSHTFNTKEMSNLINITIEQAKDLGIETATPDQIKEMIERWGIDVEKAKKRVHG